MSSHSSHHSQPRKFPWPSLAFVCTKVAWNPIFIHTLWHRPYDMRTTISGQIPTLSFQSLNVVCLLCSNMVKTLTAKIIDLLLFDKSLLFYNNKLYLICPRSYHTLLMTLIMISFITFACIVTSPHFIGKYILISILVKHEYTYVNILNT